MIYFRINQLKIHADNFYSDLFTTLIINSFKNTSYLNHLLKLNVKILIFAIFFLYEKFSFLKFKFVYKLKCLNYNIKHSLFVRYKTFRISISK